MSEILTRLNAKVQSFSDSGGKSELTTSDIAAACSGSDKLGLSVLLLKVCDDRSAQEPFFYRLYNRITDLATKQKWKTDKRGDDRIRSVMQLALFEKIAEKKCPTCNGTRYDPFDPTKKCEQCKGSGEWLLEDRDRAHAIGVSKQAWSKTWTNRYQDICAVIEGTEYTAKHQIWAKLTEPRNQ